TVMNPDETECLGCVYINPVSELLRCYRVSEDEIAAIGDDVAEVRFWARQDRLATGLEARLFAALREWLRTEWAFARVLFRMLALEA
ncbi:hypothetical protein ABTM87_19550, partial [Acinetobacter baumannii]